MPRQNEPRFGDAPYDDYRDDDRYRRDYDDDRVEDRDEYDDRAPAAGRYSRPAAGRISPRPVERTPIRRAFPAKSLWFLIGVCCGVGGMVFWGDTATLNNLITPAATPNQVQTTAVQIDPNDGAGNSAASPAVNNDRVVSSAADGPANLTQAVTLFAENLKTLIPMNVQPGVIITAVTASETTVLLDFNVDEAVADEDVGILGADVEKRFRESVCSTAPLPDNMHGLTNQGATFLIHYTELLGKTVANFTIEPKFCFNQRG